MVHSKSLEIWMMLILCFLYSASASSCDSEKGEQKFDTDTYVVGLVSEVVSKSLAEFDHFNVVDAKGEVWVFSSSGEFDGKLTPSHLRYHMVLANPIKVFYKVSKGNLVVLKVIDHN